jgi:hypothetical protein
MRSVFLMLPLLASSAGFAQTLPQAPKVLFGCPVGMTAQQSGIGQTLWTIALEDQNKAPKQTDTGGMGVHVELKGRNASTIKQVELAVHYLPAGMRFLPVETTSAPDDHSKTFDLSAENGASLKLAGDLLVGSAASILRVDLLRVDYADGTSWHNTGKGSYCSAEPSRVVRITAH